MRRWMCVVLLVGCGGSEGADAGASDAGASDAGASDAGASDAGASDAGASDAGASDAGASDAGASDAGASDAGASDASASPCPIEGSFVLDAIVCDATMDITADFQRVVSSSTMTMTATPMGCEARVTNESASCRESATQRATPGAGDVWTMTSDGIDECVPAGCRFGAMDAACALGDRAGTWSEVVVVTADTISGTRADALGICAGFGFSATEVRWRRAP